MELIRQHLLPILLLIPVLMVGIPAVLSRKWFQASPRAMHAPAMPWLAWGALAAFLVVYCTVILHGADFALSDHDQFTQYSLVGRDRPLHVWPKVGRFVPLALQEFNLLRFATTSMAGYLGACVAQLLVIAWGLQFLLRDARPMVRAATLVMFAVTPSVAIVFSDPVFTERHVGMFFVLMLCALRAHERRGSPLLFFATAAAAHFSLYYKETAFLLVGTYMLARLGLKTFQAEAPQHGGQGRVMRWAVENSVELTVLALVVVFVLLYMGLVGMHDRSTDYADRYGLPLSLAAVRYIRYDPWLWVLPGVCLLRLRQLRNGGRLDAFWDPMPLAMLAFLAGYLALRLHQELYSAPADTIAVLYSAWVISRSRLDMAKRKVIVGVAAASLFVTMAAHSGLHLLDQKARVAGKVALTRFVASAGTARNPPALYLPHAGGWELMLTSTYMDFWARRHLESGARRIVERVVLETPSVLVGGHCFSKDHAGRCRHASAPKSGELVVVMPRDNRGLATLDAPGGGLPGTHPAWEFAPSNEGLAGSLARLSLVHRLPAKWSRIRVYRVP